MNLDILYIKSNIPVRVRWLVWLLVVVSRSDIRFTRVVQGKCYLAQEGFPHDSNKVLTLDIDPNLSPHILAYLGHKPCNEALLDFLKENGFVNIRTVVCCGVYIPHTYDLFRKIVGYLGQIYLYNGRMNYVIGEDDNGKALYFEPHEDGYRYRLIFPGSECGY